MENIKHKETERIYIDKSSIDEMEEDIIIRRGMERYMYVRQFVYGHVLDVACGVGYGSYLMAKNPDVVEILAIDRSLRAINHANNCFKNDRVRYMTGEPESIIGEFDILICLETIEHLPDFGVIRDMAERNKIGEIIVSFPNKKTTHYNKYHLKDITKEDVLRLFHNYQCYKVKDMDDSTIMNFVRIERTSMSSKIYA